jgi:hypothetical protein
MAGNKSEFSARLETKSSAPAANAAQQFHKPRWVKAEVPTEYIFTKREQPEQSNDQGAHLRHAARALVERFPLQEPQ